METPTKVQLVEDLKNSFQEAINWINTQKEADFNAELVPGKWTIAGHLYHLIKSTKSVSKGMMMPKMGLSTMFGKNNRAERTYQGMVEKYKGALQRGNIKAPGSFEAEAGRTFERPALIKRFEDELRDFIQAMDHWTEAEMSEYVMPHPAIGKCTIREFVYFTILHTYHHLEILQQQYVKVA
ncbi:MAG: DinB family protein [Bacteroidota bacterium]